MRILNLTEKKSNKVMYDTETGEQINPGETFFLGESHGREAILSLADYEVNFLGLRDVSTSERKKLAKEGAALPDGSYPIANCSDAANAIHAIGRANPADRSKVRAHIKKRVKALGCSGSTFDNWK
jgi:hypothetical protein